MTSDGEQRDLLAIAKKLAIVKEAGHGEVVIKVSGHNMVYLTYTIGEYPEKKK